MDRRQRKTRTAIFQAFIRLLEHKPFNRITVEEILTAADVGRATFYAHFETKEYLLRALCEELFGHIFHSLEAPNTVQSTLFQCHAPDSAFLHLFQHLQRNDNQILALLAGQNNTLFFDHFKSGLRRLAQHLLPQLSRRKAPQLPDSFWVEFIVATFVQTLDWWLRQPERLPPETAMEYFMLAIG